MIMVSPSLDSAAEQPNPALPGFLAAVGGFSPASATYLPSVRRHSHFPPSRTPQCFRRRTVPRCIRDIRFRAVLLRSTLHLTVRTLWALEARCSRRPTLHRANLQVPSASSSHPRPGYTHTVPTRRCLRHSTSTLLRAPLRAGGNSGAVRRFRGRPLLMHFVRRSAPAAKASPPQSQAVCACASFSPVVAVDPPSITRWCARVATAEKQPLAGPSRPA